jgi:hypothetical protein
MLLLISVSANTTPQKPETKQLNGLPTFIQSKSRYGWETALKMEIRFPLLAPFSFNNLHSLGGKVQANCGNHLKNCRGFSSIE